MFNSLFTLCLNRANDVILKCYYTSVLIVYPQRSSQNYSKPAIIKNGTILYKYVANYIIFNTV